MRNALGESRALLSIRSSCRSQRSTVAPQQGEGGVVLRDRVRELDHRAAKNGHGEQQPPGCGSYGSDIGTVQS